MFLEVNAVRPTSLNQVVSCFLQNLPDANQYGFRSGGTLRLRGDFVVEEPVLFRWIHGLTLDLGTRNETFIHGDTGYSDSPLLDFTGSVGCKINGGTIRSSGYRSSVLFSRDWNRPIQGPDWVNYQSSDMHEIDGALIEGGRVATVINTGAERCGIHNSLIQSTFSDVPALKINQGKSTMQTFWCSKSTIAGSPLGGPAIWIDTNTANDGVVRAMTDFVFRDGMIVTHGNGNGSIQSESAIFIELFGQTQRFTFDGLRCECPQTKDFLGLHGNGELRGLTISNSTVGMGRRLVYCPNGRLVRANIQDVECYSQDRTWNDLIRPFVHSNILRDSKFERMGVRWAQDDNPSASNQDVFVQNPGE